ncbi:hypothetical protein [uncultured Cocleimonas sp.]|uniref:hypothetical protein n=1 Tax=uncultured Cocleimonas sp. TaxID=1051587 RepID=UPI0026193297|nr:hypothetical protein [uncultured Cocleimonas sp.]
MAKSELHRDYILEMENELQEFEMKAEATHKRMQMLVYPAMVAFFVLSAFGFFLIYSLTSDVNRMADTISHMSGSLDDNMSSISGDMSNMSVKMDSLVDSTDSMSGNLTNMTQNTNEMVTSIGGMRTATYDMAASTNNMQRDMWSMNKNISTPLSFMNNFLPWKNSQSMPFPGSRAPLPQSYFAYPAEQQTPDYSQDIPMPAPVSPPGSNYQMQQAPMQQQVPNNQGSAVINTPYLTLPAISMN